MKSHITVSSRRNTTYDEIVSETLAATTATTLTITPYQKRTLRAEMLMFEVEGLGSLMQQTEQSGGGWDRMRPNGTGRMELGHLYWIMIKMSNAKILFMFRWRLKGIVCLPSLQRENFLNKGYGYFWVILKYWSEILPQIIGHQGGCYLST